MVYLFHFDSKLSHAQHYCGYTESFRADDRLEQHMNGTGAKIMKAVAEASISWLIARIWPHGDRDFERHLKNSKNLKRVCPVCNPNGWRTSQEKSYQSCLQRRAERLQIGLKRQPITKNSRLAIGWFGIPAMPASKSTKTHIVDSKGRPLCGCRISVAKSFQWCQTFLMKDVASRTIAAECRKCEQSLSKLRKINNIRSWED
jgi:predicted GIY-YIG superfamily endonuclease